jgi:hypothetical protein
MKYAGGLSGDLLTGYFVVIHFVFRGYSFIRDQRALPELFMASCFTRSAVLNIA